ncbi:MAG: PKD domain-containing protein [Sphingobacteriales bacterium]|nr:MAG: PKD domain-containing protein [Sphingobacteriales bacterium]
MKKHLLLIIIFALTILSVLPSQAQPDPCLGSTNPLTVAVQAGNDGCACNGFAQIFVTGGTAPYVYVFNGFNMSEPFITGLCPGTYYLTVIDANGCEAIATFTIVGGIDITTIVLIPTQPDCGLNNGAITTAVTGGGTGGYTFLWSNGATTMNLSNLQPGTYCVTVSDAMGCTVSECTVLQSNLSVEYEPATCGLCNGSIEFSDSSLYIVNGPAGATQTYQGPAIINGLCPGFFMIYNTPGGCQTMVELINIDLPFTADANFNTSIGNDDILYACIGQPIQFIAPDGNLTVFWNFGEPTSLTNTSNLPNTSYTYQNTGTYEVTLITQGCTDADTLQRTIIIEQGIAPPIECASLVCPGQEQVYNTSVVCDTYNWTVSGGTITGGQNTAEITVVWNDVAMGTVELTVGDCDGSTICNPIGSIQVPIVSNNIPINGPDVVCANTNALYSVPQYGGVQYNWSINPPSSGVILWQQYNQVGVHWNNTDGVISVSLNSSLAACAAVNLLPIEVNQTYSIVGSDIVCRGSEVTYSTSAGLHNWSVTGNATIVSGGTNSNLVTIQVGLGASGFSVSATPTDITQYCDYPQTLAVDIGDQPAPPLIVSSGYVCPGSAYTYNIASPASDVSYFWTVTGGTPASGSGTSLSITWSVGSPTYNLFVTAQSNSSPFCTSSLGTNIPPLNDLVIIGDDDLCSGDKALYSAQPYLPDLTYDWEINPPLAGSIVAGQGTYNIEVQWNADYPFATLSVSACNISQSLLIAVHQPPVSSISTSGNLCAGSSIELTVIPAGFVAYEWGDGTLGNSFTASNGGSYVVNVTDANGCTSNSSIHIHQYPLPEAAISAQGLNTICSDAPTNVNISALVGDGYSYQWFENGASFGGSVSTITHTGSAAVANFTYSVQVTDANGCQNTSNVLTIIQDICNFDPGSCPGGTCPLPGGGGGGGGTCVALPGTVIGNQPVTPHCFDVTFQNTSVGGLSYVWDFGDGSPLIMSPDESPQTHTFSEPGFYVVKITGTFPNANPVPVTCNYMSYSVVEIPLKADFDHIIPCINSATQFTDRSRHSTGTTITSWNWDFGDGFSSTDTNPSHTYTVSGDYDVTLTVGDGSCTSTIVKTITIFDLPDAGFNIPLQICQAEAAVFVPEINPAAIQWDWDFGNGANVSTQQPEQSYLLDGNYTVSLTVTDNRGCVNSESQPITVLPVGNGNIGYSTLNACEGQSITLTAPAGTDYLWTDNSTGSTMNATQTGSYTVTVTQANGCTFSALPVQLNFAPSPPANITPADSPVNLCPGNSITLNANAGTNYAYSWSTGQSLSGITLQHADIPPSGLTVFVTVTDAQTGCLNVSTPIIVNAVNLAPPTINPNQPAALQLCEGESLVLNATHPTLSNFSWNNGEAGSNITVSAAGNYAVMVTDANGCTNATNVTVGVNSGGDMAAIPVGCYEYCELEPFFVPNIYAGYQWLLDGAPIAGANSNEFVPPQTGDYQLQITTVWGCQDTSDLLSLNLIDCLECLVTSSFTYSLSCSTVQLQANATGNGTLSYSWDFGDTTTDTGNLVSHSYVGSGTYTVCLTVENLAPDNDTCTETYCEDIIINGADLLSISTDSLQDTDCGETNGSISITVTGNNPPFTYEWSDLFNGEDRINLGAGIYDLTVTDSGGCETFETFTITELQMETPVLNCQTSELTQIIVGWNIITNATGYEISINGNLPILLPQGINSHTFTGLLPGQSYTISLVAIAPSPCINSLPSSVVCNTLPDPCLTTVFTITAQITPETCGQTDGAIDLSVSGGAEPYQFLWSTNDTNEDLTLITSGLYSVTITDNNGCSDTAGFTVDCNPLPDPCLTTVFSVTSQTTTATCGQADGAIDLNVGGGAEPYQFLWSNTETTEDLALVTSGSYFVTITDNNGCTATANAEVTAFLPAPELFCYNATDTELTVNWSLIADASGYNISINGETPVYLSPDVSEYTFTGLLPDENYTISLVALASFVCDDSEASSVSCTTEIPLCDPDFIGVMISVSDTLIQLGEEVQLSAVTGGFYGILIFEWAANDFVLSCTDSTCTHQPEFVTTYTVTVTDEYGCSASASIVIDVRMPNKVLIPNAFTPNTDPINSIFRVAGFNIDTYQLSVWNRWGQKVYDSGFTNDISIGWDGLHNGKESELGVYVYMANVRYTDGTEEKLKGNVTLIR